MAEFRLLAAIVETGGAGSFFIKLVGPAPTLDAVADGGVVVARLDTDAPDGHAIAAPIPKDAGSTKVELSQGT